MKTLIIVLISLLLTGCNGKANEVVIPKATEVVETMETLETIPDTMETSRIEQGRYYTNGTVITNDGNEWWYSTREISKEIPYDGMPIIVVILDNGTKEIEDDIIKGVVFDRETAIYDELEKEMNQVDGWTVTRNGNEIRISIMEGNENAK